MKVVYYQTGSGRSPVEDFAKALSAQIRADLADAISRLADGEILAMPLSRSLPDVHKGLHELRLKDAAGMYRFFYYIKVKDAIYLLHAFKKKTQGIPGREKELILRRIREL